MKLGWFSGGGESSYILFEKTYNFIKKNLPNVSIEFVFIDKELGETDKSDRFINMINNLNIPWLTLSWKKYKENKIPRDVYFAAVKDKIKKLNIDIDYIFYIGFMLITTKEIHDTWKCVNLHPALPSGPAGTWKQVIKKLMEENEDKEWLKIGGMMHYVSDELDKGKCISYYEIESPLDPKEMRERSFKYELPLIIETIMFLYMYEGGIDMTEIIANNNYQYYYGKYYENSK